MTINIKGYDATKANPSRLETYTVNFTGDLEQYNGVVTVKFRHITAQKLTQCQVINEDGEINTLATFFNVFARCVKEVHGLTHTVTEEDGSMADVEMTVEDIVNFPLMDAVTDDGANAMSVILTVVYDTARAIMGKASLTEEERKN